MHARPVSITRAYITGRRSCPRWASQSTEAMRAAGRWNPPPSRPSIDHDVIMIPNEIHEMARYSSWMTLFNAADVYFDRHLDKRSAPLRKHVHYCGFDRRCMGHGSGSTRRSQITQCATPPSLVEREVDRASIGARGEQASGVGTHLGDLLGRI